MKSPDYYLASAVCSMFMRAGLYAFELRETDPEKSARLMAHAEKMEAKYKTQHGESCWETVTRFKLRKKA